MVYFTLFVLLIGIAGVFAGESEQPRTKIKQGEIIGTTYETYSGRKVLAFYGLPFAEPPVKELRFQPPQYPPKSWEKPKVATNRSDFCVQPPLFAPAVSIGSEDCLYLDVYTPKVPENEGKCEKLYPVLFYVHPSAAFFLSGTMNEPYYMMDKHDIVFVPINYRLGILGVLTTGDDSAPGNNLYKDQVAALKWVQENIRSFCGDPNLVTIAGSSQGSLSGALHMISPLSKGLFHRVIGASAPAFIPVGFNPLGPEIGKTVANELNCPTRDTREMIKCLQLKNADIFWEYDLQFRPFLILAPPAIFESTIEVCHEGAFLTKTVSKALADGDLAQNVPLLNIESEYEGNVFVAFLAIPGVTELLDLTYKTNFKYLLGFYIQQPPKYYEQTSEAIKKEYFGDGLITGNELAFKKMTSDRLFSQALYKQVTQYSRHTKTPMYNFRDYYRGVFSTSQALSLTQTNKNYGSSHYDASLYAVFDGLADKKIRLKKKDKAMVDFMTELYYSFMVNGKPSVAEKIGWTPQPPESSEVHYLHFDNPYRMHMAKEENYGNIKFWETLPIVDFFGYPDDYCQLSGNKTSNTNNPADKNHEKNLQEIAHHNNGEQHQAQNAQQERDGAKSHNNEHDRQVDCDPDHENQMQADQMHQRQDLEKLHKHQRDDESHHREDFEKERQQQRREHFQHWKDSHKSH